MPVDAVPETVTIPGEAVLEALALLEAFASICADFVDGPGDEAIDDFYRLMTLANNALGDALGDDHQDSPPWYQAMRSRSNELQKELRQLLRGNDALRIKALEDALLALGEDVIGVMWKDDMRKWVTRREFFASLEAGN